MKSVSKYNQNLTLEYLINQPEDSIYDRGKMTTSELSSFIFRDRKTVQRKLKKLEDMNLITWVGTSVKDPRKFYIIK